MASEKVIDWCSKNIKYSPSKEEINSHLQGITDKQIRDIIQEKRIGTWSKLVDELLATIEDKSIKANLLGYNNLQEQQQTIESLEKRIRREQ